MKRSTMISMTMLLTCGCGHQVTQSSHPEAQLTSTPKPQEESPIEVSSVADMEVAASTREALFTRCVRVSDVLACREYVAARSPESPEPYPRQLALQGVLCDARDPEACLTLARLLAHGDGATQPGSPGAARKVYARVCAPTGELTTPRVECLQHIRMMRQGLGGSKDPELAASVSQWLCEAQVWRACVITGELIAQGEVPMEAGVHRTEQARVYYERAAEHGDAEASLKLGEHALWGLGVEQDRVVAVAHFDRACQGGSVGGCAQLGVMHQFGLGVERDFGMAATHYQGACEAKHVASCVALGHLVETGLVGEGMAQAVELYERGCEAGGMEACLNLGFMLEHGRGVTPDTSRAQALYAQACRGGEEGGCHRLNQEE